MNSNLSQFTLVSPQVLHVEKEGDKIRIVYGPASDNIAVLRNLSLAASTVQQQPPQLQQPIVQQQPPSNQPLQQQQQSVVVQSQQPLTTRQFHRAVSYAIELEHERINSLPSEETFDSAQYEQSMQQQQPMQYQQPLTPQQQSQLLQQPNQLVQSSSSLDRTKLRGSGKDLDSSAAKLTRWGKPLGVSAVFNDSTNDPSGASQFDMVPDSNSHRYISHVIKKDIISSNGIIHIIDRMIGLPVSATTEMKLASQLQAHTACAE